MLVRFIFLFVLIMTGPIISAWYLPWWGSGLLIVGALFILLVATAIWSDHYVSPKDMIIPVRDGRVLTGAQLTIHAVTPGTVAKSYAEQRGDAPTDNPLAELLMPSVSAWYWIEFTVTPDPKLPPPEGLEKLDSTAEYWMYWRPSIFTLVDAECEEPGESNQLQNQLRNQLIGNARSYELVHLSLDGSEETWAGSFAKTSDDTDEHFNELVANNGCKGERRIRLLFGVPKDFPKRVKLRYDYNDFQPFDLP